MCLVLHDGIAACRETRRLLLGSLGKTHSQPRRGISAQYGEGRDQGRHLHELRGEAVYGLPMVGSSFGSRRARVFASKSAARASNRVSLHARPKNEMPIGNPFTSATGSVMLG